MTEIQLKLQKQKLHHSSAAVQWGEDLATLRSREQSSYCTEFHTHLLNNTIHYPDPRNSGAKYNPDVKKNKENENHCLIEDISKTSKTNQLKNPQ